LRYYTVTAPPRESSVTSRSASAIKFRPTRC
jgi:hypothetical protein